MSLTEEIAGACPANPDAHDLHDSVIPALSNRRNALLAEIEEKKSSLRGTIEQLDQLEATMRLFDPNIDFAKLEARRDLQVAAAHHGDTMRIVMTALADAGRPLSTGVLIDLIMASRGLDKNNAKLRRTLSRRLGPSLRYAAYTRGIIRSLPGPGQMNMWELIG